MASRGYKIRRSKYVETRYLSVHSLINSVSTFSFCYSFNRHLETLVNSLGFLVDELTNAVFLSFFQLNQHEAVFLSGHELEIFLNGTTENKLTDIKPLQWVRRKVFKISFLASNTTVGSE